MRLLAPKYGLSDVGLAKICKKYNIPRPWLGYWTQVKHGVAIGPTELPDPDDDPEIVIRPYRPPVDGATGQGDFTNIFDRALEAEAYASKITVPKEAKLHDSIASLMSCLREQPQGEWGRSTPGISGTLNVRVSKKQLHRAHLILDILLSELDKRGADVFSTTRFGGSGLRVLGEQIGIQIVELLMVKEVDSRGKILRSDYYESRPQPLWLAKQTVKPSGRLLLKLEPYWNLWDRRLRRNWRDAKKQRLEDCINDIIVGMIRIAAAQRESVEECIERSAEHKDEEERKKRREQLQAAIDARVGKMNAEVARWSKAQSIRNYVAAARERTKDVPKKDRTRVSRWLDWVDGRANLVDPLSPSNIKGIGMKVDDEEPAGYVRPALEREYPVILELIRRSYRAGGGSGDLEAELVQALRGCGACDPELSLVALLDGRIAGYGMFGNVCVRGRSFMCGVAIGPLCVDPRFQRRGIGTELIDAGICAAIDRGKAFVYTHNPFPGSFYENPDFESAREYGVEGPFHSEDDLFWPLRAIRKAEEALFIEYPRPWKAMISG